VKHVLAKAGNGERNPPLTPPKRGIIHAALVTRSNKMKIPILWT